MHYVISLIIRIKSFLYCMFLKSIHQNDFMFSGLPIIGKGTRIYFNKGKIILNNIGIRKNCEISVSNNALIYFGKNVFLNNGCMLISHKGITIGDNTRLGPNVLIYDHDYNFKDRKKFKKGIHNTEKVIIGSNCWIGAGSIILKGTKLGDNCIVGAGSVVKGEYQSGSVIIQKRTEEIKKIKP